MQLPSLGLLVEGLAWRRHASRMRLSIRLTCRRTASNKHVLRQHVPTTAIALAVLMSADAKRHEGTESASSRISYSHNGALRKQDLVGLVPFLSDLLSDMYMHYIVHYIALHSALQKTA